MSKKEPAPERGGKDGEEAQTGRGERLLAAGDKLLCRVEQAAEKAEEGEVMDPLDIQRLAAALKTLRDVAETGKGDGTPTGVTVIFEGDQREGDE